MLDKCQKIPSGMRDWLNGEAKNKRALTNRLLELLGSWGYQEVTTPILEYYEVLVQGESSSESDQLYKLIDRDGSILALRPEMTTPIARVVSNKIQGQPPWRLMYGGEVFRYENIQTGKQREFAQVGVELIGQKGAEADGEILVLAIEALREVGLDSFTVSLGHTGVLAGILQSFSEDEKEIDLARSLILEKDFVGLQQLLAQTGLAKAAAEQMVDLLTNPQSRLADIAQQNLPSQVQEALQEIAKIVEVVESCGYASYIQVDLSTLRHQSYYTGMVFEIYTRGIGYPIGGGGRYDHLLRRFGKDYPATGFALGVERLLLSLPLPAESKPVVLLAGDGAAPGQLAKKARELRSSGRQVIIELRRMNRTQAQEAAGELKGELVFLEEGSLNGI